MAQCHSLIVGNAISNADQDRVKRLLEAVVTDGRIVSVSDGTFQKTLSKTIAASGLYGRYLIGNLSG